MIKEESSGILNWALEGCLDWQKQGINIPNEIKVAVKEYKDDMDILKEFLEEVCIPGDKVLSSYLFKIYQIWMAASREKPWGKQYFLSKMEERGNIRVNDTHGYFFRGIILEEKYTRILQPEHTEKDQIQMMCELKFGKKEEKPEDIKNTVIFEEEKDEPLYGENNWES